MSHALLSPSGASRWLACTPSARLELQFPDSSGAAAAEGTLAHKLCELMILRELKWLSKFNYDLEVKAVKENKLYTSEMWGYAQDYTTFVLEKYYEALALDPNAKILIEEKIDLKHFIPEGFGTGDCCIIASGQLIFIDLKYGKGVEVSAEKNPQLMLYASGILQKYELEYGIESVTMFIYQPRRDNISSYTMTVDDLWAWVHNYASPRAKLAFAGEGDFEPGEKTCLFCKAKAQCRAFAEYNLKTAELAFKDVELLSDGEMSDILKKAKVFKNWISSVETFALAQAFHHKKQWPGFKLVAGRSVRKYKDPEAIIKLLKESGFRESSILQPAKLKTFDDLTAFIGKDKFKELVEPNLIKPGGAPTLVPLSDKREACDKFDSAVDAFAGIEVEPD